MAASGFGDKTPIGAIAYKYAVAMLEKKMCSIYKIILFILIVVNVAFAQYRVYSKDTVYTHSWYRFKFIYDDERIAKKITAQEGLPDHGIRLVTKEGSSISAYAGYGFSEDQIKDVAACTAKETPSIFKYYYECDGYMRALFWRISLDEQMAPCTYYSVDYRDFGNAPDMEFFNSVLNAFTLTPDSFGVK